MPADRKLSFRLGTTLAERASRRAAEQQTRLSAVLRLLLSDYVNRRTAPVELARELAALRRELLAVGRNLNQVARAINRGLAPPTYLPVTERLTDVIQRVVVRLGTPDFRLERRR